MQLKDDWGNAGSENGIGIDVVNKNFCRCRYLNRLRAEMETKSSFLELKFEANMELKSM